MLYTLPLLQELAGVKVMIVGDHMDHFHVSAACRKPLRAFHLALATMSLPTVVVLRVMVRKTSKCERGASATSGYPAHHAQTLPTRWRGPADPRSRLAALTSNFRQRRARCRLSVLPLGSSVEIGVTSPHSVRYTSVGPTSAAERPCGDSVTFS